MPDTVRPNIEVPATLWGEVKVSAFRRGIKPQEVVLEMLREKFDDDYRSERGMPSRASVKRLRDKVDGLGSSDVPVVKVAPTTISVPQKATPCESEGGEQLQTRMIGGQPINEKVCVDCGKPMGSDPHYSCKKCRDKQKDGQ